jgi:hypothetical protein
MHPLERQKTGHYRTTIGYVGENGIKPNTAYRLNSKHEFEEVESVPAHHPDRPCILLRASSCISRCFPDRPGAGQSAQHQSAFAAIAPRRVGWRAHN